MDLDTSLFESNAPAREEAAPGILQVIASINERIGGPAYSVSRLANELGRLGVTSQVNTLDYPELGPLPSLHHAHIQSLRVDSVSRKVRGFSLNYLQELYRQVDPSSKKSASFRIVHNHGLWMFPNFAARLAATRARIPLIISPRGMLQPWSLRQGVLKKALYWNFIEKFNLRAAAVFHATSPIEAQAIRNAGFAQPIAIIPNGIDLPDLNQPSLRGLLESRFSELKEKRWLLFLSRLDRKKRVDLLIDTWAKLQEEHPKWHLIIAGPDLQGLRGRLQRRASHRSAVERITFAGMLSGDEKRAAYDGAEVFVLPSHSENFGLVIGESLAHETPVITTDGTPWQMLDDEGAGWCIKRTEAALEASLEAALRNSPETLKEMGKNGRALIQKEYSWKRIARDMLDLYLWVDGRVERPEYVE